MNDAGNPRRRPFGRPDLVIALLAALLGMTSPQRTEAQAVPTVTINLPSNGMSVEDTSPFYDAATESMRVQGVVASLPNQVNYSILVQGVPVPLVPLGGGLFQFSTRVAIGPNPPAWAGGVWPSWYPYLTHFTESNRIYLPIVAEVLHNPTQRVLSRDRVAVYDKRRHGDLQTERAATSITSSLAMQLTADGLEALAPVHTSTLPYPDKPSFDAALTAAAAGQTEAIETPTGLLAADRSCFPLTEEEALFTATGAYSSAVLAAEAQKLLYDAAKQVAQGTPTPADDIAVEASFCVKKSPEPKHFEVCVGRVEGELETLSLGSVDDVTLAYSTAPGHLFAERVDVSDLRAVIPGQLTDVFIRWTEGLPTCLVRPQGSVDGADLDLPEIDAWSRCLDLEATVDAHTDGPIDMTFEPDPNDPELLDMQRVLGADFLSSNERTVSRVGTCAQAFVNDQVELLIERFFYHMEDALGGAWDAAPMQEADALELLLARFEHGTYEPTDHELFSRLQTLSSFEDFDFDGDADVQGMFGEFDTDAELRPEFEASSKLPFWVYPPNHDFPYSGDGRDAYGRPFDVMFATSTGALNQIIRERTITDRLYQTLAPTCDELGLTGQPYCPTGDTVPALDGSVLGDRFSGFAALGATQVAIVMHPTMMPFTRIHPDPPPTNPGDPVPPPGRAPLLYHLGQYVVELVEIQPNPGTVWLRMYMDFFDEDLQLSLNPVPGTRLLNADLGVPLTGLTIVETGFGATCPMVSVRNVPAFAAACSRQMGADMADLLTPVLEHSLIDMLREYPAPMYFDAEGLATPPAHVQQTDRYQGNQNILFYADIP